MACAAAICRLALAAFRAVTIFVLLTDRGRFTISMYATFHCSSEAGAGDKYHDFVGSASKRKEHSA